MAESEKLPLCLVCGERGEIYETGNELHPFSCHKCDAWGVSEDNVDTPFEEGEDGSILPAEGSIWPGKPTKTGA